MPKVKVLIVDDEPRIVQSLADILRAEGYHVLPAYSAREALEFAAQSCPDILLTDVLMPDKNGFELALEIKERCPHCRLLLFSGQAATAQLASDYAQRFTTAGYRFELLPKPLRPEQLLKQLEQALIHAA